jgi:iron(III) transport system permease protein
MRTIQRVVVPLMAGGILAGFVTSFITAAVELSATILLTSAESQAPMSYGIYLYMQSIAGRGPGAALGVLAILIVALGTYVSHLVVERAGNRLAQRPVDDVLPPLPPELPSQNSLTSVSPKPNAV